MKTVNPYLTFNGNCEEAFNYYKSVFGGEFPYVGRFKDMPAGSPVPEELREKIMHISLPIGKETTLMGADASEVFGPLPSFGDNISLMVNTDSEVEAQRIFSALSDGGKITMPLEKTFWNALFGMCTDQFGIGWMVSFDYSDHA